MKSFKKIVGSAVLAFLLLISSVACNTNDKNELDVPVGAPNYEQDVERKKIRFGAWSAPPSYVPDAFRGQTESFITTEHYQGVKDCGLDFINGLYEREVSNDVLQALDCAQEVGVKYLPYVPSLKNNYTSTPEALYDKLKPLLEHEACMGIFAWDEPSLQVIHQIAAVSEIYQQITDKYLYVNLFPSYASSELLGTDNFRTYLNTYSAKVKNKMLSVDYYPYSYNGMAYNIDPGFLQNLEFDQKYCMAYGKEHWEFIQASDGLNNYQAHNYAQFSHQIYCSMAFGTQVMQYFCYWTPSGDVSSEGTCLVSPGGIKRASWYDAQKINGEIHNFDHVFMNYVDGWKGIMTVIGTNNLKGKNTAFNRLESPLVSYDRIKSVTATEDTLIGCFEDSNGYDGFLAVNYTVPDNNLSNEVVFEFVSADQAIVYLHGEKTVVGVKNGKISVTLEPGQGAFIIPVKTK